MAETEKVTDQTEEQAAASFAAGFDEATPAETPTAQGSTAPDQQPEPTAETPPASEYVQLTRQDFEKIMAATEKVGTYGSQFDKVFGTIGNLQQQQQQLIGRLQSETPRGSSVQIDDADFAELKENFPELAGQTKAAIERIFKKANLVGTGTPAPVMVDDEKVREAWKTQRIREELEELSDLHPDWQTIVGRPEEEGNEFRQWLAKQPEDYQNRILNTTSARMTARAIDRFLEAKLPPATARGSTTAAPANIRQRRMMEAAQQSGTGIRPTPQRPTAEDEFRSGFLNG